MKFSSLVILPHKNYITMTGKDLKLNVNQDESSQCRRSHIFIHLFIHFGYLCSAPSRNLFRGALSPATAKEKCVGLQEQCKREFIPSGGANHRESLMLFKSRTGPRNQELTMG